MATVNDYDSLALALHYDSIHNVSKSLPHNPAASGWNDISGNNRNGTFATSGFEWIDEKGLRFNGGQRLTYSASGITINRSYTMSVLFKPVFVGSYPRLFAENTFPTLYLRTNDSNFTYGVYSHGIDTNYLDPNGQPIRPIENDWNHATVVYNYDTKTLKLYVNGLLVSTRTNLTTTATNQNIAYLGARSQNDRFFTGSISTFMLYERALSDTEVLNNYKIDYERYVVEPEPEPPEPITDTPIKVIEGMFESSQNGYEWDISILKSEFSERPPFLIFSDNQKNPLYFNLEKETATTLFYTVRLNVVAGLNEVYIYAADSDKSDERKTFTEFTSFANGLPWGWQTAPHSGTLSSQNDFNSLQWVNNLGTFWFAENGFLRHQGGDSFLRPPLRMTEESKGFTYESLLECLPHNTYWIFGFGSRNTSAGNHADGINCRDASMSEVFNAINAVSFGNFNIESTLTKFVAGFSVYENSGKAYLIRESTYTKFQSNEGVRTNDISQTRFSLKYWGGYQQSRWYWMRKRHNPIPNTFIIKDYEPPIPE